MGSWSKILGGIGVAAGLVGFAIHSTKKEQQEEERRKSNVCEFEDGVTNEEFTDIVHTSAKGIKRLTNISVNEAVVCGEFRSQSGLTDWSFSLDFNDYGHITGKCWTESENEDSTIPKVLRERIQKALKLKLLG